MFVRDNSNFYLQPYYTIMIIIPKTSPNFFVNWDRIISCIYMILIKVSQDFMEIVIYIVHKIYRCVTLFHRTQVKL